MFERKVDAEESLPVSIFSCLKTGKQVSLAQIKRANLVSLPIIVSLCIFGIYSFDIPVALYFRSLDENIRNTFHFISKFGYGMWYILLSFAAFIFFRFIYKQTRLSNQALFIFLSIVSSGLIVDIFKFIFGRYRPEMLFEHNLYGFIFFQIEGDMTSFPSGHTSNITAFLLSLYFIYPKYGYISLVLILLIASSRVVIGAHFPTDVIFGLYVATMTTIYLKYVFDKKGIEVRWQAITAKNSRPLP